MRKNIYIKSILMISLMFSISLWSADDHAGHNHAEGEHNEEISKQVELDHDEHDGHDHENEEDHDNHVEDEHNDTEEENHDGHDHDDESDESEEMEIKLSKQAIELAGIKMQNVSKKRLAKTIEMPGEIGINEDKLAHITPRFAGIAKEVKKRLGQFVKAGEVLAVVESNESLTPYNVVAPISGNIIEKHITRGEFVGEEEPIFVIADLSKVWVNCEIYPQTAQYIKKGQKAKIEAVGVNQQTIGDISYIAPIFDTEKRSAIARFEISSEQNKWRPGMFVYASIKNYSKNEVPVVEKKAIQVLNEKNVLFVEEHKNVFVPVEVVIGMSDENFVEIKKGLHVGEAYVSEGAFELKAKIVTSALGDHAGHGH